MSRIHGSRIGEACATVLVFVYGCSCTSATADVESVLSDVRGLDLNSPEAKSAPERLLALGPAAIPPLIEHLDEEDETVVLICADVLSHSQDGGRAVIAAAQSVKFDEKIRAECTSIIGESHFSARDHALAALMQDRSPRIRSRAAGAARRGDVRVLVPPLKSLLQSSLRSDRVPAIQSLGHLAPREIVDNLGDYLSSGDKMIVRAAVSAAGVAMADIYAEKVASFLSSPDINMRLCAWDALRQMHTARANKATLAAMKKLPSPVIAGLIRIIDPNDREFVKALSLLFASFQDPSVRSALQSLRKTQTHPGETPK
jgi:HEAT repeat protein